MRIHDEVLDLLAEAYRKDAVEWEINLTKEEYEALKQEWPDRMAKPCNGIIPVWPQETERLAMPNFGWFVDLLFAEGKFGTSPPYNKFGYSNYGRPSIWELFGT